MSDQEEITLKRSDFKALVELQKAQEGDLRKMTAAFGEINKEIQKLTSSKMGLATLMTNPSKVDNILKTLTTVIVPIGDRWTPFFEQKDKKNENG